VFKFVTYADISVSYKMLDTKYTPLFKSTLVRRRLLWTSPSSNTAKSQLKMNDVSCRVEKHKAFTAHDTYDLISRSTST